MAKYTWGEFDECHHVHNIKHILWWFLFVSILDFKIGEWQWRGENIPASRTVGNDDNGDDDDDDSDNWQKITAAAATAAAESVLMPLAAK